jgi:hypothetical protein
MRKTICEWKTLQQKRASKIRVVTLRIQHRPDRELKMLTQKAAEVTSRGINKSSDEKHEIVVEGKNPEKRLGSTANRFVIRCEEG